MNDIAIRIAAHAGDALSCLCGVVGLGLLQGVALYMRLTVGIAVVDLNSGIGTPDLIVPLCFAPGSLKTWC